MIIVRDGHSVFLSLLTELLDVKRSFKLDVPFHVEGRGDAFTIERTFPWRENIDHLLEIYFLFFSQVVGDFASDSDYLGLHSSGEHVDDILLNRTHVGKSELLSTIDSFAEHLVDAEDTARRVDTSTIVIDCVVGRLAPIRSHQVSFLGVETLRQISLRDDHLASSLTVPGIAKSLTLFITVDDPVEVRCCAVEDS